MSKRRFNTEQDAEILRRYLAGESSESIAKDFVPGEHVDGVTIRNTLHRLGVVMRKAAHQMNPVVSEEQKQRVVVLCRDEGYTLQEAADEVGISKETTFKVTKAAGVVFPVGKQRTCDVNDAAFDELTPASLYWMGFLWADGNVHQDVIQEPRKNRATAGAPSINIGLSAVDFEHLEKFRDFLGSSHAISFRAPRSNAPTRKGGPRVATGPSVYFNVRSTRLCEALTSRGFATKRPIPPHQDLVNSRDFWRGAIDGDGWVTSIEAYGHVYPVVGLSGQMPLLEAFRGFLSRQGLADLNIKFNEGCSVISTSGDSAEKIIALLYKDADVFLDRKNEIAQMIMRGDVIVAREETQEWAKRSPVLQGEEEVAFQHLRKQSFPYPEMLSAEDIEREVRQLREQQSLLRDNVIEPRSRAGLRACYPFFPNRYEAVAKGSSSAFLSWHNPLALRKAIRFQLEHGDPVEPHRVLRAITLRCRTPGIFRPAVAKFIYERYCRPGDRVWDPCSGYGGRLLGAFAAGVRYIGTDVEERTVEGNCKLAATIGFDAELHVAAAESFDAPEVSLVFTSPPYLDRERYSQSAEQAWIKHRGGLDAWLDGFLRPVVQRAHQCLVEAGHLVLNVADLRERNEVIPVVSEATKAILGCGFDHVETLQMPLAAINRVSPTEPILVFRKTRAAPPEDDAAL